MPSVWKQKKEIFTIAIQHQHTSYHQDRVPVELKGRAIPGETTTPLAVPETHTRHTGQTQAQAQKIPYVEAGNGPHPGDASTL